MLCPDLGSWLHLYADFSILLGFATCGLLQRVDAHGFSLKIWINSGLNSWGGRFDISLQGGGAIRSVQKYPFSLSARGNETFHLHPPQNSFPGRDGAWRSEPDSQIFLVAEVLVLSMKPCSRILGACSRNVSPGGAADSLSCWRRWHSDKTRSKHLLLLHTRSAWPSASQIGQLGSVFQQTLAAAQLCNQLTGFNTASTVSNSVLC